MLEKCQHDFKAYQQKFQFTIEDINVRENKQTQLEYELEEALNHSQIIKQQNQELLHANSGAKLDYERLADQKRQAEKEITRLESAISELQMSFTSSHQQLRNEVIFGNKNIFPKNNFKYFVVLFLNKIDKSI